MSPGSVAQALQDKLRQPFVVESRPGASSKVGTAYVARAKPDGYTLLLFSGSYLVNPSTYKDLPYDTLKDFETITACWARTPMFWSPTRSLPRAISKRADQSWPSHSAASSHTGRPGFGGPLHLAAELFKSAAKVDIVHVPYKGTSAMFPTW